ncbi:hypothetical protein LC087_10685 [Bacillus carboniphilus]|uniref:Uncharacterized protein n=1 Tax=Bacillus carboniphilus TaxID=86663 RepID=A0ABY9JPP1_9BACI|nr:hypothetical protein [Bacillus carboniphilus]WLR41376.1 hypothetical protein LC087_10685 [Bacillus carboniphilus]
MHIGVFIGLGMIIIGHVVLFFDMRNRKLIENSFDYITGILFEFPNPIFFITLGFIVFFGSLYT